MKSDIDSYIRSARAEFEEKLQDWVEIPTISAEPAHKPYIERGANAAVDYLRSLGAEAEAIRTPGNPVVTARFVTGKNRPTVTIYNHLDVQPANEPQWQREPFVFHKEGDRYIGRGSTDDKGPALTALFGARYALEQGTAVNIQFIWELEEEIGSPNFEHFLDCSGQAGSRIWSTRPCARAAGTGNGHQGCSFRCDRRRCAEPHHRVVPAGGRMLRRSKRTGANSGILRRRREVIESRDGKLPRIRFYGETVQAGARAEENARRRCCGYCRPLVGETNL